MPFVTTGEMMKQAQAGAYAIGAFNAENLEMVQAIIAAAEAENASVIIQTIFQISADRDAGRYPADLDPRRLYEFRNVHGRRLAFEA